MQGEHRKYENCDKSLTRFASGFLFSSRLTQINQVLILKITAIDKEASGSLSVGFTQCNLVVLTQDQMTLNRNQLELNELIEKNAFVWMVEHDVFHKAVPGGYNQNSN